MFEVHWITSSLCKIRLVNRTEDLQTLKGLSEPQDLVGLTQQELADAVGVTRQTINALENARYNPSLVLAYRIAKVLDKDNIEDVFILGTEDLL